MSERKRWLAFYLLCAGEFMIVIDTTIINVALPSIQESLRFSDTAPVWVVNAYMVAAVLSVFLSPSTSTSAVSQPVAERT